MEGAIFVQHAILESLSEQQLVSCDKLDQGCNGGTMDHAFKYAEKNGLALGSQYPYTGKTGSCQPSLTTPPARDSKVVSYVDVPANSEAALKAAVAKQPVSVAIEADKQAFQFYKSGILKASAGCGTEPDMGALVVGYGEDGGTKYWKLKNSWGATLGRSRLCPSREDRLNRLKGHMWHRDGSELPCGRGRAHTAHAAHAAHAAHSCPNAAAMFAI